MQLQNKGAGMPDGGLFTADQLRRYWEQYRLVLITNYRAFALIGCAPDGKPALLERFELASYARDAKARIESAELPALSGLRSGLEEALGLHFTGDKGEHFFRSTLIQTLFYGIFSAWVLWTRKGRAAGSAKPSQKNAFSMAIKESSSGYQTASDRFDWYSAVWNLRVPMIRALFGQIATPERLGPLGLKEVLDWTGAALNRVDADAFFAAFDEGHAVQYFYEPFLQAFDPELRKELGVWYTPSEIVDYQVEHVDTVLREELNIPDGLAAPRVIVLDPCCGTQGVTCGKIRDDLKAVGLCQRVDNKQINPDAGDLELTAGWGHAGKEGVTMPGRGRVEPSVGSTDCIDVYLNGDVCWKNIPQATWEMTIGGYQVLKKWLSYREKTILGRSLTLTEARTFAETARRLTALMALQQKENGFSNPLKHGQESPCPLWNRGQTRMALR